MKIEVLLVEDNPAQAHLTMEAFRDAIVHCDVSVVEDGEAALDFLRKQPPYEQAPRPDLILLDLNLPKIGGLDVLETVKSDPALQNIPVIVLTVSSSPKDVEAAYRHQAAGFVTKPLDLDEYFMEVRLLKELWFKIMKMPKAEQTGA
jgi:CheY-like chemotaxis protein